MGNTSTRNNYHDNHIYSSQYSLKDLIGGSCVGSSRSSYKQGRTWSRSSCRGWSEDTLNESLGCSKTLWPVSRSQAMFLPEFPIQQIRLQKAYTFMDVIGEGSYGKVYKIRKQDTGQLFALKVISKAKVISENSVQQTRQEVAIQKLVGHHPFILGCSFGCQERKTLYIVTDYVGGGELYSLMQQWGCLPENVVRIYVAEVALAIDFLHNAGVVHRDIKSKNILLDNEGHAVLIDFGFAKWLSYSEKTNTLCGTPEYMAPEVYHMQYYGHEVDWWSLGVLACFMLTNERPCVPSIELSVNKRPDESYTLPTILPPDAEKISPAAKDLLIRLLQCDASLRLKSLLSLQRIGFYMGYDLHKYLQKKESPFRLLGIDDKMLQEMKLREFSNRTPRHNNTSAVEER